MDCAVYTTVGVIIKTGSPCSSMLITSHLLKVVWNGSPGSPGSFTDYKLCRERSLYLQPLAGC